MAWSHQFHLAQANGLLWFAQSRAIGREPDGKIEIRGKTEPSFDF